MARISKEVNKNDILEFMLSRGYIATAEVDGEIKPAITGVEQTRALLMQGTTLYQGFDPSGKSLHLGHFMAMMALHHLQEAGNKVIFLLGGATGRVGDPTDKKSTRKFLTKETVEGNAASLRKQVESMGLLSFKDGRALMLNNDDWIAPETFLDFFMMEIAPYFSVNSMVNMDTFRRRLEDGSHLSLLEFLYPTLQAWDFLYLYREYECMIQVGGKDQWGNILQGRDLVKAHHPGADVQGMTFPLLTTPSGEKMGKTEKGPVWLNPTMTSPFDFYQYLQRIPDEQLGELLRLFTFLPEGEIEEILKGDPREAQKRLAFEVTSIVHGSEEANKAEVNATTLSATGSAYLEDAIPSITIDAPTYLDDVMVNAGQLPSKSEVRRRCSGGAIRISGKKIKDPKHKIVETCTIQFGKGKYLEVVFKD